ncbi:LysM peptidoglycan-binding domain-containing protein [Sansalvadorimonas verongulae]|uniref:LysM peptidoglycan-binding domain-containing protein n=1 Tax=Sansalvadorimonas verongulae TaxID=2172824 RepID=UPI0012BBD3D9|nr:LysM peptidoglycan-binding domain-containing protein [Sansalvadorimonas verongulae]MTI14653.1 LysM peptidoglycan-binding domain-containing protein [Sansalvadorimonas verongulae]
MYDKTPTQDACSKGLFGHSLKLLTPVAFAVALSGCQSLSHVHTVEGGQQTTADTSLISDTQSADPAAVANSEEVAPVVVPDLPPEDLVTVIREGLNLDLDADNPRIRAELRWYSRHQSYFNRVLKRSEPYLYYIVSEAQRRNIPMEIALLPVIESAFDPFAYSFARASGLWQFMPATGRHYGLEQNWWYDGRRDVVAATDAAYTYLEELNKQFNDWELALAAYNSGRGTVANAIKRNRKKGKPTDFWSLSLPRETSAYVPKLLAISKIVRNPEKYNIKLNTVPNEPYFKQVNIGQQIDLARAASLAEMKLDDLYRLNPAFNRWATNPDGPHTLLIPIEKADSFKESLDALPPEQRLKWQRYTISSGDSLILIAKRFSTSVDLIRDINQISGSRIVAGKTLLIPVPSKDSDNYSLTAEQRRLAKASRPVKGHNKIDYVVKSGDSFWDIAREYDVTVSKLTSWNSMTPRDTLRIGQKLVIWTTAAKQSSQGVVRKLTYRVRSGDNLSVIAYRYGVKVSDIRNWNNTLGKYLQPGDTLTLFVDVTR